MLQTQQQAMHQNICIMTQILILALIPKGTGETKIGTGAAAATVTSSGAYDLRLDTNSGTNSSYINIVDAANGNVQLYPNGTGLTEIGGGTNAGTIQLNCENNSHGIKLQSPAHSASQSYTLIFPTGNVTAGTFLKVASITGSGTNGCWSIIFCGSRNFMASSKNFYIHSSSWRRIFCKHNKWCYNYEFTCRNIRR